MIVKIIGNLVGSTIKGNCCVSLSGGIITVDLLTSRLINNRQLSLLVLLRNGLINNSIVIEVVLDLSTKGRRTILISIFVGVTRVLNRWVRIVNI